MEEFVRTEMLLGKENAERLRNKRVIVFGVGGVGGYVCEALCRSGIGQIDVVDDVDVSTSNINRQIIALHSTLGRKKVDAMCERMRDINPYVRATPYPVFYSYDNENAFDFSQYDYIVDAIDTVSGKIALAVKAQEAGVPIISSMGAGNKLDPTAFKVADIYKTSVCPLARVMRYELKKRNVKTLKVVYSEEKPREVEIPEHLKGEKKIPPASCAFIPSVVGLIIASEVIKDLAGLD